jgi:hypothetical protein
MLYFKFSKLAKPNFKQFVLSILNPKKTIYGKVNEIFLLVYQI